MKKILMVFLTLVFSLGSVVNLWGQVMKGDVILGEKILKETFHSEKKSQRSTTPATGQIVIIGASYVKGWNMESLAGLEIMNRGINGEKSGEMLARFEKDVISPKPKMVIIWGFINDIFGSRREDMQGTLERIKENYKKMVKMSQGKGIRPIIATEITIRPKNSWRETMAGWVGGILGKESYQEFVNKNVIAMNKWVREFGRAENLFVLDFEPILSDHKSVRRKEFATDDGSHISQKGYDKLSSYTQEVLEKLL